MDVLSSFSGTDWYCTQVVLETSVSEEEAALLMTWESDGSKNRLNPKLLHAPEEQKFYFKDEEVYPLASVSDRWFCNRDPIGTDPMVRSSDGFLDNQ